jgi:hypothetical protein
MRLPSFSIATLMLFVAMAALDASLLRQIGVWESNEKVASACSIFVMVNILAVGFLRIMSLRGRNCRFLIGFEFAGSMAVLGYWGCFRWLPDQTYELYSQVQMPVYRFCEIFLPSWVSNSMWAEYLDQHVFYVKYALILAVLPIFTAPFVLSQVAFALIGGFLFRGVVCTKTVQHRRIDADSGF